MELQTYAMAVSDLLPFPPLRIHWRPLRENQNYRNCIAGLASSHAQLQACRCYAVHRGALRYIDLKLAFLNDGSRPNPQSIDGMILDGPIKRPRRAGGAAMAGGGDHDADVADFFDNDG